MAEKNLNSGKENRLNKIIFDLIEATQITYVASISIAKNEIHIEIILEKDYNIKKGGINCEYSNSM